MEYKLLSSLIRSDDDGDINALERIFFEMKDSIFSFVLMYTGNRQMAEDILQETVLYLL